MEQKIINSFCEWHNVDSSLVTIGRVSDKHAWVNFNGGHNNFYCKLNTKGVVKNSWNLDK